MHTASTCPRKVISMKWKGKFSKWCSCSMLVSVCVPLEIHPKRTPEIHGGRKIWVYWSSPGFYIWWPAASDPEKLDSVLTFSDFHAPPPYSEPEGPMVWGSCSVGSHKRSYEGVGWSSHLRDVMELVVKITRPYSVEQGCVHKKRMLRRGKDPIFSMALFWPLFAGSKAHSSE